MLVGRFAAGDIYRTCNVETVFCSEILLEQVTLVSLLEFPLKRLGVFRRACGKPHTRADNKQL